jgi:hypothetical protein
VEPLTLTPSNDGWVHADWQTGHCWVRFVPDTDGKLKLAEAHTTEPENLRGIPIGRIRAACLARGAGGIAEKLAGRLNEQMSVEDLSKRPSMVTATAGVANVTVTGLDASARRYILQRPPGKLLDDSFYRNVARAYQSAVALGLSPNKTIAADAHVQISTVAAWVHATRRLGHLPPTKQGRVTA